MGRREEATPGGKRMVVTHTDPILRLRVESVYEAFDGVPVVRRHSRVTNEGKEPVGIEFLSSAMLHGLLRPSEMGVVENERTSRMPLSSCHPADPQNYDRELRRHVALNSSHSPPLPSELTLLKTCYLPV